MLDKELIPVAERKTVLKPFMKWPGGKSWLLQQEPNLFNLSYNKYIEPFIGGGAVFFYLLPNSGIISDSNEELINTYLVMRDYPKELSEKIKIHSSLHNSEYYYYIRSIHPNDPIERAARMIYLNRTCFNGLYRVNQKGEFNVPIGTRNTCLKGIELFEKYSNTLSGIHIECNDFAPIIENASKGDLLFIDPPYLSSKKSEIFSKYNSRLFDWEDQKRLCKCLKDASNTGAKIIMTNAYDNNIKGLYTDFSIRPIERRSSIAGKVSKRKNVMELLITANI